MLFSRSTRQNSIEGPHPSLLQKTGIFRRLFQKRERCTCNELDMMRRTDFMKQINTARQPESPVRKSPTKQNKVVRGRTLQRLSKQRPSHEPIDEDPFSLLCPCCQAEASRDTLVE